MSAFSPEDSLDELAQLAGTAGAQVVGRVIQQLPVPTKTYYIGKGKLDELLEDDCSLARQFHQRCS